MDGCGQNQIPFSGSPQYMEYQPVFPQNSSDEQYKTVVHPYPNSYETIALSALIELSPPVDLGCCAVLTPNGCFYTTSNDAISGVFSGSICLMRHCNRTLDLLLPVTPCGYLNPIILQYIREQFVAANVKATTTHMPVIVDISAFQNFMQFYHMVMENYWFNMPTLQQSTVVPMITIPQPPPIFVPQQMIPFPCPPQVPFQVFTNGKKNRYPVSGNRPHLNTNAREFVPKPESPAVPQSNEVKPLPTPKDLPYIPSFDWVKESSVTKKFEKEEPQKGMATMMSNDEGIQKPHLMKKFENGERLSETKMESGNEQFQGKFDERMVREESVQKSEILDQSSQPVIRQHRRVYFQSRHISQTRNEVPQKIKVKPVHYSTVNGWPKKDSKMTGKICDFDEYRGSSSSDDNDVIGRSKENVEGKNECKEKVGRIQVNQKNPKKVENLPKELSVEPTIMEGSFQFSRSLPSSPKKQFEVSVEGTKKLMSSKSEKKFEERELVQKEEMTVNPESKSKKKKQGRKTQGSISKFSDTSISIEQESSMKHSVSDKFEQITGRMADVRLIDTKLDLKGSGRKTETFRRWKPSL